MAVDWNGDAVIRQMRTRAATAATRAADHVADTIRRDISRPGPSDPGEPPGRQSGALLGSVRTLPASAGEDRVTAAIEVGGPTAPYARDLEFGFVGTTPDGRVVSLEPRPFFRRARLRERTAIGRVIGRELKDRL